MAGNHTLNRYGGTGERPRPESWREDTLARDPAHRLKWMLQWTMGAPNAFENRRRELSSRCGWQPPGV